MTNPREEKEWDENRCGEMENGYLGKPKDFTAYHVWEEICAETSVWDKLTDEQWMNIWRHVARLHNASIRTLLSSRDEAQEKAVRERLRLMRDTLTELYAIGTTTSYGDVIPPVVLKQNVVEELDEIISSLSTNSDNEKQL